MLRDAWTCKRADTLARLARLVNIGGVQGEGPLGKSMKLLAAVTATATLSSAQASAATDAEAAYAEPLDGRAYASPEFVALITTLQGRPDWQSSLGPEDSQRMVDIVLGDGVLSALETDLLEELTSDRIVGIQIVDEQQPTITKRFPSLKEGQRVPVERALNAGWEPDCAGGKTAWAQLVPFYTSGSKQADARAVSALAGKMADAWAQSNVGNGYKPFRDVISTCYRANGQLTEAQQRHGKLLMTAAARKTDAGADGAMPDVLYNWIGPKD